VNSPCVAERRGAKRSGASDRSAAPAKLKGFVTVHHPRVAKEEPSLLEQGEGHGIHPRTWSGCGRTSRRARAWNGQKVVLGTGVTGVRALLDGLAAELRAAAWDEATDPERRVLVEELVEQVTVFPDHLEIKVAGAPRLNVSLVGLPRFDGQVDYAA
jgi:hypothetical protein